MVEWSITAVLKTAVLRGTGGSNPSLSAKNKPSRRCREIGTFSFYIATSKARFCKLMYEKKKEKLHYNFFFLIFDKSKSNKIKTIWNLGFCGLS